MFRLDAEAKQVPWMDLLQEALTQPGLLSEAYRLFHDYSAGNQLLAMLQLGGKVGPIATFKGWQERGRQIKKGEKAIALYMPVVIYPKKGEAAGVDGAEGQDSGESPKNSSGESPKKRGGKTVFILRRRWFSLAQTEGETEPVFAEAPEWDRDRALAKLGIELVSFDYPSGNVLGYSMANEPQVAVSPLAPSPLKTLFHELGHQLLHREARQAHAAVPPMDVREVEAEAIAYLCCASLGVELDHLAESRGYIQSWLSDPEERHVFARKHAGRVFGAVGRILAAGKVVSVSAEPLAEAA